MELVTGETSTGRFPEGSSFVFIFVFEGSDENNGKH
jgi:hypothetical protein